MPPRETETNPWDTAPVEEHRGRFAAATLLSISLVLGAVAAAWPILLVAFRRRPTPAAVQGFLLWWIAILTAALLCLRLHAVLIRRSRLDRLERKCALARIPIFFQSITLFRSLRGPGSVMFREDDVRLTAVSSPDFLLILPLSLLPCLLAAFAFPAILQTHPQALALAGPAGTVLVLGLGAILGRRVRSIIVRPQDLSLVRCDGPLVRLFFVFPPVRRIREIAFFVWADREKFFRGFNAVFPGLLPAAYADVLQRHEIG